MSKIVLSAALKSGKGNIRQNNEDAFYFNGKHPELKDMDQEATLSEQYDGEQALFAICDGMGGYENGEVASYTAVSRMGELQQKLLSADFPETVGQWVDKTNTAVNEAAKNGGCTLALLYFNKDRIHIAHIGDSRIYRYYHGMLSRMTKDHSKLQVLLDAGIITEAEAENYPQRHVITRALGMNEEENGKCMPTIQESALADDQDWYIICSDGVTDMLTDTRIESLLSQAETPADCAEAIYHEALNAGGKDNTSVIVIEVRNDEQEADNGSDKTDLYESTWTPEQHVSDPFKIDEQRTSEPISIEQFTTISQANGQKVTIRTQIQSSRIKGHITLN